VDSMLRIIDTTKSLGIDAKEVSESSATEMLKRNPQLKNHFSERAIACIAEDGARHLEYLGISVEQDNAQTFNDHLCWIGRVLVARGVNKDHFVEHVEILRDILSQRLEENISTKVLQIMDTGLATLKETSLDESAVIPIDENLRVTEELYLRAALKGNRQEASKVIEDGLDQGLEPRDIYLGVFQPTMYEVGRLWESNKISVAQEHIATAITQYVMTQYYSRLYSKHQLKSKSLIAMTGVAGELHEIGPRMVSDFLESEGWEVLYLGTNLPAENIVNCLSEKSPLLIGISVTMAFNLSAVSELIQKIRVPTTLMNTKIIVGGSGFRLNKDHWKTMGADGWAKDAGKALQLVSDLAN
jgi:MerR family transcriptional regulator, light-induced transcriptional regulator